MSVIVKFTSFRKSTLVYRKNKYIKYWLDWVKNFPYIKFCFGDINYQIKVNWKDDIVYDCSLIPMMLSVSPCQVCRSIKSITTSVKINI